MPPDAPDAPAHPHQPRSLLGRTGVGLRNSFFAGVVVIAPIGLTVWLIWTAVGWVDSWVMPFVPRYWHPDAIVNRWLGNPRGSEDWIDVNVRGLGVVVFLIFTILVGWIAKGLIGRSLLRMGEDIVARVPLISTVYGAVKQIAETVFVREGSMAFDRVCLIEWPRPQMWRVAFTIKPIGGEVAEKLGHRGDFVTVFMPNTPNAATGLTFFAARSEIIELDMGFEEATKLIVSGGLVAPEQPRRADAPEAPERAARSP